MEWPTSASRRRVQSNARLKLGVMRKKERPCVMRGSSPMLLCLFVGSAPAMAADNQFCENLAQFAQDLNGNEEREVTLFSEWSAEPTKGCRHDVSDARSIRFCEWMLGHTSTEFMEANVGNVLACLAGNRWRGMEGSVEFLTGKVRFSEHKLRGAKSVVFEVEYSVRHEDDTDMLRIAVSPLDAE